MGAPLYRSERYNDEGRVYIFENVGDSSSVSILIYKVFRKPSSGLLLLSGRKILKDTNLDLI